MVLLFCIASHASAQTQPSASPQAIAFVQRFYDWYLPIALNDHLKEAASNIAIGRKPELFDAILLRALRNDAAAQAKAVGEIDGLDFDPFLNSQDPSTHFKVIRTKGSLINVVGYDEQISKPRERVSVEVRCVEQQCVFVNFFYPASGSLGKMDLLSILRLLHPAPKSK